jgi:murein DD-endopeptidase MepM/ murein hydrolase activator NlpD
VRPFVEYRYEFLVGDPSAEHAPPGPYRVPFAVASDFPVSQAYPDVVTHTTPDSRYAVDIVMPVGTDVFAARSGTVFDVSAANFRGGTDALRDISLANVVRILHDDGTYAVYAHLNWNSIRVRVGDYVERGEYIADSGNTGYSSGPHLHFVVVRNAGMAMHSVPVQFAGVNASPIAPATGQSLTAY